ncbi:ABC transporter permease [Nesterenkonia sp. AN1]|uniref:ABC transporter permease n=1 Tax=Nesterenkonia sp. AN1 TaxID=652017 RepID=UPI00044DFD4B|nr:ABC transporter permease [Nesterenkonia sp. AN1]
MNLTWLSSNLSWILELTLAHLWLTLIPTVVGLALALPLGWWAHQVPRLYGLIVGTSGLFYTIPSLAFFVLLPGVIGTQILDPINVVIALTIYTLALMVRVVADGLAAVPRETVEAAEAMGYRAFQRFTRVQLPVAVPVILAGLRVAVVSNISIVTMAAIIGVQQLGSLFTQGYSLGLMTPIVTGIILCLLIAVVLDLLILGLSRMLTPWRPAAARSVTARSASATKTRPASAGATTGPSRPSPSEGSGKGVLS